ncbi:MAG: ankyrin repeat domain-containing protein [Blastocatellia bacterium]
MTKKRSPRQLSPKSSLDNLKKEAKRWLKTLRANDEQARARFSRAYLGAPAEPKLREVQHALALEHGLAEYLLSPVPMFAAARRDRADVVEFLLDLGVSPDIEDAQKQRPLHEAASNDSLRVAELLIERGAEIEPVETNWNNTPLDHAMYGQKTRMIEFLSRFTRDVFRLTWIGNIERLHEVLGEEPDLAKAAGNGNTPLMWLPEDEVRAKEIVELLVARGADPKIRNKEGMTAADCVEQRGLYDVAELLRSMERFPS